MSGEGSEYRAIRDLIGRLRDVSIEPTRSALLLVDLQYLDASAEGEQAVRARRAGTWPEIAPYFERVAATVVPATSRLLAAAREHSMPVMFTRCVSFTPDARDNGRRFREFGIVVPPDSRDAEILQELDQRPGDLVWSKTTASVFLSTNIDRTLRQMGIDTLVVGGVVTSGCVESAVRDACDLDYGVVLVDDACADRTPELHEQALKRLHRNFATVRSSEDVLAELSPTPSRGGPSD